MLPDRVSNPDKALSGELSSPGTDLVSINFVSPFHSVCIYSQLLIFQTQVCPKIVISQSKFSDPRKFTLRYL